jgi:hypothetical protein
LTRTRGNDDDGTEMRFIRSTRTLTAALALLFAAACSSKSTDAPSSDEASSDEPADDEPIAADESADGRKTRLLTCEFLRFDGEGDEREALFRIANTEERPVTSAQTWIYYYDAEDGYVDRYPHAINLTLAPGETLERKLGQRGDRIKEQTAVADCEITRVGFDDGETWFNENLISAGLTERPRGGPTHEQLLAREGETVTATTTDDELAGGRAVTTLKNISGRPLLVKVAWTYYYDADGEYLTRHVTNLRHSLEPDATETLPLGKAELPEGARYIETVVTEVDFRDGDKENWRNNNLAPLAGRPMQGALAP